MRFVPITNYVGSECWLNADAVAYVVSYGESCIIHFIGAKDNELQSKETLQEIAKKISGTAKVE
jgi:hypothetical protein